jgi:hypothetical protein
VQGFNPYFSGGWVGWVGGWGGWVGGVGGWVVGDSGNKATLSHLDFDLGFGKTKMKSRYFGKFNIIFANHAAR